MAAGAGDGAAGRVQCTLCRLSRRYSLRATPAGGTLAVWLQS